MSVREVHWTTKKGTKGKAWLVAYIDQSGQRRFKNFKKQKDAKAYEIRVGAEVQQGIHTAPSQSITVAQAGAQWVAHCKNEGLEPSTIAQYEQHLKLHIKPRIGSEKLARLTTPRINTFRDDLLATVSSRALARKVLTSLKSLLKDAQQRGNVAQNVAAPVSIKRTDREKREKHHVKAGEDFPTPAEVKTLIDAATGKWRALLIVATCTGLRASELRGLRWENVDLKRAELHVNERADCYRKSGAPKSKSSKRTIPLGSVTVNALKAWKLESGPDADLLFPGSNGGIEHHANLLRGILPVFKAAGLVIKGDKDKPDRAKYALHAFRHFFASWCLNPTERGGRGLQSNVVQALLGHSSIVMTNDVYGHLFPRSDDRSELAAAETALLA